MPITGYQFADRYARYASSSVDDSDAAFAWATPKTISAVVVHANGRVSETTTAVKRVVMSGLRTILMEEDWREEKMRTFLFVQLIEPVARWSGQAGFDPEEVGQQVYGDLLSERRAFQKCTTNPMGFLARIITRRAIDFYRRERKETCDPLDDQKLNYCSDWQAARQLTEAEIRVDLFALFEADSEQLRKYAKCRIKGQRLTDAANSVGLKPTGVSRMERVFMERVRNYFAQR